MDLSDQLKNLFPDHIPEDDPDTRSTNTSLPFYIHQTPPLECVYEKRKGKPTTVIKGYQGANQDFKQLSSALKSMLNVGGGIAQETIVIQGDYRDKIMTYLKECGFTVKRVGG